MGSTGSSAWIPVRRTCASGSRRRLTTCDVCGFSIPHEGSCATTEVVTINVARWVRGAVSFQGALVEYKQYVINHEVGHGLGYNHKPCQESGALAPVMMQQSWDVSNDYLAALGTDRRAADGKVCKPNAWPYPTGSRRSGSIGRLVRTSIRRARRLHRSP
ncbi:DUF3152 domain-containing protein [Saccharothrix longispora]|uniref:DUF3152 domain-containing protein n=1 Tax=Saccharothrix longispora TaxID=33920 RepID=UPI0028FD2CCF|nr:DUF3152 domain-containing protein [Saccharothrix longispora]MDU0294608.1 DUF3152 domain-containing protein [Saccharothrix longispora]